MNRLTHNSQRTDAVAYSQGAPKFPLVIRLPAGGYIDIDRPLPLLCLHDRSQCTHQDPSLEILVQGAPAYVITASATDWEHARPHVQQVVNDALTEFRRCILVELEELRPAESEPSSGQYELPTVIVDYDASCSAARDAVRALDAALSAEQVDGAAPCVQLHKQAETPSMFPGLDGADVIRIRLRIRGDFFDAKRKSIRRYLLREFSEKLNGAILEMAWIVLQPAAKTFMAGARAFGRRHLSKVVGEIEHELVRIFRSFDLLLGLTPINTESAFTEFLQNGCEKTPTFKYRALAVDPDLLMRQLYNLPIETVEDITLSRILHEQREHIDNQLSMLRYRNTRRCQYASLHAYGGVEDKLYRLARAIPEVLLKDSSPDAGPTFDASQFAWLAREEIEFYARQDERFNPTIELRDDVASLTIAADKLLIPVNTRLTSIRARGLLAHEVGIHLLTFFNGCAQPLQLMSTGLAGYEQLQEGLAVFAEYLAGGLTPARLRLLAARVIAVKHLLDGGSFVEIFRRLHRELDFEGRAAFLVTMRVCRGGGFTKDACYLRGLLEVLDYIEGDTPLEPLLRGKFGAHQLPLVNDLAARDLVRRPALLPRVLTTPDGKRRLAALSNGNHTVLDLCERSSS